MPMRMLPCILSFALLMASGCTDSTAPEKKPPFGASEQAVNNRAVGLMGQYEYARARALFEELAEKWPERSDIQVNLAIATLNRQQEGDERRALETVQRVLQAEPDHLRAQYVAGLVRLYQGRSAEALAHFESVATADPADGHAAYFLAMCHAQQGDYENALDWYQRAMARDPYLRSAYYGAFQSLQRLQRAEEAMDLAREYQRLENNPRSHLAEFKYTRMGPKGAALAIDAAVEPVAPYPQGAVFAEPVRLAISSETPFRWPSPPAAPPPSVTSVSLQVDGPPLLLLSGAVEAAAPDGVTAWTNLVLEKQADGAYAAVSNHPLAAVSEVNSALWGDFDNDGRVDVYFCRRGENQLWRQTESGEWKDVTATTGTAGGSLDTADGAFFDADHDGDLDIFLVNADGPVELLNNNLDGTFRPLAADYGIAGDGGGSVMVLPADLDNDRDADVIILNRTPPHAVFLNDRLWSYRTAPGYERFRDHLAVAAVAADLDADGQIELYTLDPAGVLRRWRSDADGQMQPDTLPTGDLPEGLTPERLATYDVNGDGKLDLAVSSAAGWAVLEVDGDSVEILHAAMAPPQDPFLASLPFIGDSLSGPAMLALSPAAGLTLWPPGPGRYPFITLALSGRQEDAESMRSNASGVGAQIAVRAGSNWSRLQNYRNDSARGQSLEPLAVGLGGQTRADFVSIDWSDGVFQSELGVETGALSTITETQRQLSSCPVLFAWNGEEYAFVSDFLGVGGIGYAIGPGEYSEPRPWENFLLPEGALQPSGERYLLKIGEPMEEVAYLDAVRLAVYDLPPEWNMVMDERMGIAGPEPTGEARFYRNEMRPVTAVNDRGEAVLDAVLERDYRAPPVGEIDRRFIGRLQGEHLLSLDFPQALDSHEGAPLLVIDGWVEYAYSQTSFAAWQAGAAYLAPTLEARIDGEWQPVYEQFGFPAGMPRRMSLPLPQLPPGTTSLRLRTNMQIYWDRIAVAWAETPPGRNRQLMPLAAARLSQTGFARRSTLGQFRPHYDYSNSTPFWDTRYLEGFYTRLGPVEELVGTTDDAVAIIGPGEEVHLEFQVAGPAPRGWNRFYVLETNGWAKDMDLFTRDGETVGPLPTTGQPADVRDRLHAHYNTRYQSGY